MFYLNTRLHFNKQWTRLIRFLAVETSQIHIGQPIDSSLDVGLAIYRNELVKANEIIGSALDPNAQLSNTVLTVKKLLSPLAPEQIGLVRCLGLNYADHAVRTHYRLCGFSFTDSSRRLRQISQNQRTSGFNVWISDH